MVRPAFIPFLVDPACLQKLCKESQLPVRRRPGLVVPLNLHPPFWRLEGKRSCLVNDLVNAPGFAKPAPSLPFTAFLPHQLPDLG
jgi:hypothetical protein